MISQNIRFKAIYVRSKTFICIYWLAIPIYTYIRLERIFLVLYIIRWSHWFYDSWRSYLIFFWYIALYYLNNTDSMILMQNCIWSIYSFLQREFVDYNPHWFYDSCATCQFMLLMNALLSFRLLGTIPSPFYILPDSMILVSGL